MPQLHELIAVESDIKNTAVKILAETQHTFAQKQAHFQGLIKTYRPFNEADKDSPGNEIKPMVTTVREKLDYTLPYIVRQLDVIYQKEKTNSKAVADIVFEDEDGNVNTIAAAVPVTTLVQYEKVLTSVRLCAEQIPTLDPAFKWTPDPTQAGVYKTDEFQKSRTKKVVKPIVMYDATKEHPAQTQLITSDDPVGTWTELLTSGALSPLQKSQLLAKIDRMIEAIKRARSKANKTEAETTKIGAAIVKAIFE